MPVFRSVNFTKYTTTKLIEMFLLLIGFGLLYFAYDEKDKVGSMVIVHGGVFFMTMVTLILLIGIIFKKEPSTSAYLVINLIGFMFFAIVGILLLGRAGVMSYRHKDQQSLGYYNKEWPGNKIASHLASGKISIPLLLAGVFAILNALCFMAEIIFVYFPQLHFLLFQKEHYLKHGARNRALNMAGAPTQARSRQNVIPGQDEEAEF